MNGDPVDELSRWVRRAKRILIFTGAGISTGSGIPDFRGPRGLWKRRQPVYYQDYLVSEAARIEHWDYKLESFEVFGRAKPNAAHLAIAGLERRGMLEALVTQNIDGLHEAAGSSAGKIIELHGTNRWIECIGCGRKFEPAPLFEEFRKTRKPPSCDCGGLLKTATVMFGQAMPQEKMRAAHAAARRADLVISAGSTLEVQPAASVPLARGPGAPYAVINLGATEHDGLCDLRIEADVVEILPRVLGGAAD